VNLRTFFFSFLLFTLAAVPWSGGRVGAEGWEAEGRGGDGAGAGDAARGAAGGEAGEIVRVPAGGNQRGQPILGGDRLDRFRQLAGFHLALLELQGPDPSGDGLQEISGLLDEELIENLNSGPLFASEEFLQERLDAFGDVWGGSAFRVLKLAGSTLTVGIFQLSPGGHGNSVRIYVQNGGRFQLGQVVRRPGIPMLFELPPTGSGAGQFLLAWVGPQSSRGSLALRVDLWRQEGGTIRSVWSTAALFPDELLATGFRVRGQSAMIRYEVRYPGWKPGCEGQSEQEDLYQYAPDRERFILARRRTINGWHRELHSRAVSPLLGALAAGDHGALAQLVPDPAVRARLPKLLEADLACDTPNGPVPSETLVSAVAPRDRRVWDLRFRQLPSGWRLVDAIPVE
jgi:hypothetical protein